MLDTKDLSFLEVRERFDFKGFLIKLGSYWKWFLVSLTVCIFIAYQVNIRKEKIYAMEATIKIKEENNPFFTSNTSLVFNWGGTSDKIKGVAFDLKSRSHNEHVVDTLNYFIDYLVQQKYYLKDVYGEVPFEVVPDKTKAQLANTLITIKFVSPTDYELSCQFDDPEVHVNYYSDITKETVKVEPGKFVKVFKVGERVSLPFLNLRLNLEPDPGSYIGKEYQVRFTDFYPKVAQYQNLKTDVDEKNSIRNQIESSGNQ